MNLVLTAAALAIALIVVPLAVIVIGIHHQESAGLAARHAGLCAAIACTVLALHAAPPISDRRPPHAVIAPGHSRRRTAPSTRRGSDAAWEPAALCAGARP